MMQEAPPGFPTSTLPVQRALVALSLSHPQKVESAVGHFWDNFWVHWNDPNQPENMQAILRTVLGSDEEAKAMIERTKTDEVKKALSANTNKAFEDGAFGLPWFVGKFFFLWVRAAGRVLTVIRSYKCQRGDGGVLGRGSYGSDV